ncbi:hypothetical protein DFA_00187 [Cavenderia fasciculata]|uniref:Uncharacterized protein n=1 Tax=Cavenderia fasciculata TaxID=261658 RepID=F4PXU9_CACFS|nr:uncharacterized protein DFA_00187 [Cavenderia fasciculata]EGG19609.1 hypothetical protein DFA_00187 [Cavenderia fasciculata]|eukprot:XP_004357903.1 hypothetical protein DFA_00187 [Cavenderia fasciculata]
MSLLQVPFFYSATNNRINLSRSQENTTIKEYSIDGSPFARNLYAERPSTRFFMSEVRVQKNKKELHTAICLPSMIPHIDKYQIHSIDYNRIHIEQSCQVLTGSPYIKTVKLVGDHYESYDYELFNRFTLSLPNLECLRIDVTSMPKHISMVVELLKRNQIQHMTIGGVKSNLHTQMVSIFDAVKTNKSLISLKINGSSNMIQKEEEEKERFNLYYQFNSR